MNNVLYNTLVHQKKRTKKQRIPDCDFLMLKLGLFNKRKYPYQVPVFNKALS